jgi:murein L,D-transpeptidase YafK
VIPLARWRKVLKTLILLLAFLLAVPVDAAVKADRILVLKEKRELLLMHGKVVLKAFPIALGFRPIGAKRWEGDGRTPEGVYQIDGRLPDSHYHLALHISYPNANDQLRADAAQRPVGGAIMIHGMPEWFEGDRELLFAADWTNGCIAVSNAAIEEIWLAVDDGTPIEIRR